MSMRNEILLSYPFSILYGLYFYLLFHIVFVIRFGRINPAVSHLDLGIIVVGVLSSLALLFYVRKLPEGKRLLMLIPFAIAVPLAYLTTLMGGLLGLPGIMIFGVVPFVIALPIGHWMITRFVRL